MKLNPPVDLQALFALYDTYRIRLLWLHVPLRLLVVLLLLASSAGMLHLGQQVFHQTGVDLQGMLVWLLGTAASWCVLIYGYNQLPDLIDQLDDRLERLKLKDVLLTHLLAETWETLEHRFVPAEYQLVGTKILSLQDGLEVTFHFVTPAGRLVEVVCKHRGPRTPTEVSFLVCEEDRARRIAVQAPVIHQALFGPPQQVV